jgi:hypothetical protein
VSHTAVRVSRQASFLSQLLDIIIIIVYVSTATSTSWWMCKSIALTDVSQQVMS